MQQPLLLESQRRRWRRSPLCACGSRCCCSRRSAANGSPAAHIKPGVEGDGQPSNGVVQPPRPVAHCAVHRVCRPGSGVGVGCACEGPAGALVEGVRLAEGARQGAPRLQWVALCVFRYGARLAAHASGPEPGRLSTPRAAGLVPPSKAAPRHASSARRPAVAPGAAPCRAAPCVVMKSPALANSSAKKVPATSHQGERPGPASVTPHMACQKSSAHVPMTAPATARPAASLRGGLGAARSVARQGQGQWAGRKAWKGGLVARGGRRAAALRRMHAMPHPPTAARASGKSHALAPATLPVKELCVVAGVPLVLIRHGVLLLPGFEGRVAEWCRRRRHMLVGRRRGVRCVRHGCCQPRGRCCLRLRYSSRPFCAPLGCVEASRCLALCAEVLLPQ